MLVQLPQVCLFFFYLMICLRITTSQPTFTLRQMTTSAPWIKDELMVSVTNSTLSELVSPPVPLTDRWFWMFLFLLHKISCFFGFCCFLSLLAVALRFHTHLSLHITFLPCVWLMFKMRSTASSSCFTVWLNDKLTDNWQTTLCRTLHCRRNTTLFPDDSQDRMHFIHAWFASLEGIFSVTPSHVLLLELKTDANGLPIMQEDFPSFSSYCINMSRVNEEWHFFCTPCLFSAPFEAHILLPMYLQTVAMWMQLRLRASLSL